QRGLDWWKPTDCPDDVIEIYVRPAGEPWCGPVTSIELRGCPLDAFVHALRRGMPEAADASKFLVKGLAKFSRNMIDRKPNRPRGRKPDYRYAECVWLSEYCEWTIKEIADKFCNEGHHHWYDNDPATGITVRAGSRCWGKFEKRIRDYWNSSSVSVVFPLVP